MAASQAATEPLHSPRIAGPARRLAAFLLDGLIAVCVVIIISITMRGFRALGLWMPATQDPQTTWGNLKISAKLAVVFGFLLSMGAIYLPLFEASPWQASFGKRILDVHVTDTEGRRISVVRAFGRWIAKLFFNWFFLWPVSLGTMARTREKKALHDFVARTLVVRGQPEPGGSLEAWRIAAAFGIPYVWLLGTFLIILQ
jgi:uncharacterized RDD family membrane protein YckC